MICYRRGALALTSKAFRHSLRIKLGTEATLLQSHQARAEMMEFSLLFFSK